MKSVICIYVLSIVGIYFSETYDKNRFSFKSTSGKQCKSDSDCVQDSYCFNKDVCMCKDKYVADTSFSEIVCLKEAEYIGDLCRTDIQCTAAFGTRSYCHKNYPQPTGNCRCVNGSHFQDGICYESARLGGKCQVNNNCISLSNVSTYCDRSVCVCAPNYHPNADGTDCLFTSQIGTRCLTDDDCVTANSFCREVCHCKVNYVISSDGNRCLQAADALGQQCEEDAQCREYMRDTFCDPSLRSCQCSPEAHETDKTCWVNITLGESCKDDRQCIVKSNVRSAVACRNKLCKCTEGYRMNEHRTDCLKGGTSRLEQYSFLIISAVLLLYIPYEN